MSRIQPFGTVGAKIFSAFFLMSVIAGALGAYSYALLHKTGRIVVETYDGPLMAIGHARSASATFTQIENRLLHAKIAGRNELHTFDDGVDALILSFLSDLDVAEDRASADNEREMVRELRPLALKWNDMRNAGTGAANEEMRMLGERIVYLLDLLVEFNAGNSFVERRKAIAAIENFESTSIFITILALVLSAGITWTLRRRIVRPLSDAAFAADRIAVGEFDTAIPLSKGRDETATLLRSMSVMRDKVSEMMARETAQRHSAENRLADALQSSFEGVILLDNDGRIVLANGQMEQFFPDAVSRFSSGTDFELTLRTMQEAFLSPTGSGCNTWKDLQWPQSEHQLQNGRWINVNANATREGGAILFISDITHLKEREDVLRKATREAEAASAAKSSFLANMSHELRTPLNAIIGFSEIISGEIFGKLHNARYVEYATDIRDSGNRLLGVINNVLEIARADSDSAHFEADNVLLSDILEDCADSIAGACRDANVNLDASGISGQLTTIGEPGKLRQVFLNLLSNAVKFNKSGGCIRLVARAEDDEIVVDVRDTGIGMSEKEVVVALTPFGQVDGRLERRYEGAGLGLPLAASFVKLHRGRMLVESEPGKGTLVSVRIPAAGPSIRAAG